MIAFNLPLTITKGVTFGPVIFTFKQADTSPMPLTNWVVLAYARRTKDAKEKIDLVPVITDAANGEVRIQFTDEETLVLMGGEYSWDMVLQTPTGERLGPYFEGKLKVKEINTHG